MNKYEVNHGTQKPIAPEIISSAIPAAMKEARRWLLWGYEWSGDKWDKVPYQPNHVKASSTDSKTWCDFETALEAIDDFDGLGFALGDGWAGVDLDDCLRGSQQSDLAQTIVGRLNTYTEVSPSRTGLKAIIRGTLPPKHRTKNKPGTVEIYTRDRYFCITGHSIANTKVSKSQAALTAVWNDFIGADAATEVASDGRGVHYPTLEAMLRIEPKPGENDGSKRLFAVCCRAIGHNLSYESGVATVLEYAKTYPFPKPFTVPEILQRLKDAENKVVRGSEVVIRVNTDVARVVTEAVDALSLTTIYQNDSSILTRYVENPPKCKQAKHDNGSPRLEVLPSGAMLEVLCKAASWQVFTGKEWTPVRPDAELRHAILNRQNYPGVKVVYGVVSSPILLGNGEIVTRPGYDPDSGLILNIEGDWPELKDNATAIRLLSDVLEDFPFEGPSHFSACLAALLTLLCRHLIKGNTPFFPFDGNRPGCGKGLATDVLTMIAEGRRASRYNYTNNQDELRKALTSLAIAGKNYILFDNIKGRFGGSVLEAAMTTGRISDRILKESKIVEIPLSITWLGTVNDLNYERDMMRRSVPVMFNTDLPNPHLRTDFKHPRLLQYVEDNRRELLIAGLSIVANYLQVGQPKPEAGIPEFGSFNEWSDLVRGALIYAGQPDPCDHCSALYDDLGDSVMDSTQRLVDAWAFDKPVTAKQAIDAIYGDQDHHAAMVRLLRADGDDDESTPQERLGKMLRSARKQVCNGKYLDHNGAKRPAWSLKAA